MIEKEQNINIKEKSVLKRDDRQLVKKILDGDRDAASYFISQICVKYFDYIKRQYLYKLDIEIGDLISDFYIFLQENNWKKLRGFRFESKLETWVCFIASRHLYKKYQKELKENAKTNPQIEDSYLVQFKTMDTRMSKFELIDAINQIKNNRERLLMLYTLEGYETEEIAEKLETSNNNVYILRNRAVNHLRALLNDK